MQPLRGKDPSGFLPSNDVPFWGPVLQGGGFKRGITVKGRFSELMKSIEVSVALNPAAPLIGAAYDAMKM
jgi:glucokinase